MDTDKILRSSLFMLNLFVYSTLFSQLQLLLQIPVQYPVGLLLAIITTGFMFRRADKKIFTFLWIVLLGIISFNFFDVSYDGTSYHQEAIIQIANGWNPYWDNELQETIGHSMWINAYPKALWIFSAVLFKVTGNLLIGKMYQLILFSVSLCCMYLFLKNELHLKKNMAYVLSLVVILNPVVGQQLFTYYNDSSIYMMLLILSYLIFLRFFLQRPNCNLNFTIIGLILVLSNIKFTALIYVVLLGIVMCFLLGKSKSWKKEAMIQFSRTWILSLVLGIAVFGYNPYLTNIFKHGTPFWPLSGGAQTVDIISDQESAEFLKENRFLKFFISNFAQTRNITKTVIDDKRLGPPVLKFPGTIYKEEIYAYIGEDTRIAGFGPWFSLLSVISIFLTWDMWRKKQIKAEYIYIWSAILASVLINPECWWARYVPQAYLLNIMIFSLWLSKNMEKKKLEIGILLLVLTLNSIGIFGVKTVADLQKNKRIYSAIKEMHTMMQYPVEVYYGGNRSFRISVFDNHNIDYREITSRDNSHGKTERNIVQELRLYY